MIKFTINYIQDDIDDLLFDYCLIEDNKVFVNGEDYFDLLLKHLNECKLDGKQIEINNELFNKLGEVLPDIYQDAKAIYDNDPAANSEREVMLCYPGFKAIAYYRIAHVFYELGYKVTARYISELAHSKTGIDIHPGAKIGRRFALDHGTGVVIGETTEIGENVIIYQGVTLGAIHLENRDQVGQKRHPTIKDSVVIYANATILGGDTVIGNGAVIGANTFITKSVAAGDKVKIN